MILKVNRAIYDRYNPEQMILEGEYVKVEDKDRIEFMIAEGLAEPAQKEPDSYIVFGKEIETAEKKPEPKNTTSKRVSAKKG